MKHIRGLISTAQALRQTFVVPRTQALPRPQFLQFCPVQSPLQLRFRYNKADAPPPDIEELRDEDIRSDFIQIVNEDNKLNPPSRLNAVLRSIDRRTHYILQVSPAQPGQDPVCKIINRSEHYKRTRELAKAVKAARAANQAVKQIELNWAIDDHDLSHRLGQMAKFLDKGRKVEVILLRRKHRQTPTPEMVNSLMEKVLQAVKDAGAAQISPVEGEPGKRLMYTVKKKDS
ncbi:putative translation initiation factor IF3 [Aspergillus undulatus]|uniref:putative translation initiation factor IF3 n=1 Tax=Aspergillus undulatus TaxID=1810928 RepID=UPI003CCE155E